MNKTDLFTPLSRQDRKNRKTVLDTLQAAEEYLIRKFYRPRSFLNPITTTHVFSLPFVFSIISCISALRKSTATVELISGINALFRSSQNQYSCFTPGAETACKIFFINRSNIFFLFALFGYFFSFNSTLLLRVLFILFCNILDMRLFYGLVYFR